MSQRPAAKSEIGSRPVHRSSADDEPIRRTAANTTAEGGKSEIEQSLVTSAATLPEFVHLANSDTSGLVRLTLASTLQRLPVSQRLDLAAALLARKEDADDHNLPLLIWYGLIPAGTPTQQPSPSCCEGELPTRKFIAHRLTEGHEESA
jgi:hypothetical protein